MPSCVTSVDYLPVQAFLQFAWLWRLGLIPACRRILAIVDHRNRTCLYPVSGLILASLYFAQGYCVNHPPSLSSLKRVHPRRATSKQTALSADLLASVHRPYGFLPNDPSPHTRSDLFRLPLSVSGRFVVCMVHILHIM